MSLLNDDFLLTTPMAKKLFHDHAEKMPIIDFHCHLDPKEIYENKNYKNISRIWINEGNFGDHYKWRLMRANGVPEDLITGDGDDYQKFLAWAGTIEKALGNPLFEWTHLELRRFFGINDVFNTKTAPAIWEKANQLLATDDFKPRNLIKRSNVQVVCTTDDPASDLKYHKLLKKEEDQNGFKVLPAMRPDKAFNLTDDGYGDYLDQLAKVSGKKITSFKSLVGALRQRFQYFESLGGRLSDHGLNFFHFVKASDDEMNEIIDKARNNKQLTKTEIDQYQTMLVEALMHLNKEFNWTMQFHMNVIRNANKPMLKSFGTDGGFDSMGTQPDLAQEFMKLLMDAQEEDQIPKMIIYSLNPNDWMELATGMGDFQQDGVQKLQLGAAWWFNDTFSGMKKQLTIMAEESLLPNFVGMLTDSRSFLSYPRHEYFRRVLCNVIGEWAERGQAPDDEDYLGKIVEDISYNNAHDQFHFFDQD
ncbi:glucuronate isomerase [Lentilactobacillus buchneri]|uniref:Uronate isomerase n=1 Tax=Lentilactobacillus buchneri subsp. silagei CD034 TaxID=1071400 RepID=J9W4C1_LENBU|nr:MULTISPECIES: glucuronate isomerase [Lentilactobacillus]MCC6101493.1 glucuronate isomerase [Lactobacillus sp.]AFS01184.1 Glucuronate isomerase [Lentilactobacillus buchneri subsp. silagei CD034]MCT2901333.1 glucuronate isomerase [Lentilactobacillus buchneri]MCT3541719.1 glucuronate isomerase [Lentilactobacillus buchneri]MCT3543890.1 glucuronate isomerase [Lentilactobacillus buchneri]